MNAANKARLERMTEREKVDWLFRTLSDAAVISVALSDEEKSEEFRKAINALRRATDEYMDEVLEKEEVA